MFVPDEDGLNRFKSGFFVDNFATTDFIDDRTVMLPEDGILRPFRDATTLTGLLSPKTSVPDNELDLAVDYDLLDSNVKKTGNVVTLDYTEKQYISQITRKVLLQHPQLPIRSTHTTIQQPYLHPIL